MNDLRYEIEFQEIYDKTEELIREGGERFTSDSTLTFEVLNSWWWDLDKLGNGRVVFGEDLKPKTMHLGRAVASIFLNAVAEADDWFDQNKTVFLAAKSSEIKSSLLGFRVGGNDIFSVTLNDAVSLVEEYICLMVDGEQKDLATSSLTNFLDIPFRELEWEVSEGINTYDHKMAIEHKKKTLESYMDLGYALGTGDSFNREYLEWNKKIILALQVDDDIRDFDDDLREGTVNVMVGFYHEELDKEVEDEQARQIAKRRVDRFVFLQKLEGNYPYWLFRNFVGPFVVSKVIEQWSKV